VEIERERMMVDEIEKESERGGEIERERVRGVDIEREIERGLETVEGSSARRVKNKIRKPWIFRERGTILIVNKT